MKINKLLLPCLLLSNIFAGAANASERDLSPYNIPNGLIGLGQYVLLEVLHYSNVDGARNLLGLCETTFDLQNHEHISWALAPAKTSLDRYQRQHDEKGFPDYKPQEQGKSEFDPFLFRAIELVSELDDAEIHANELEKAIQEKGTELSKARKIVEEKTSACVSFVFKMFDGIKPIVSALDYILRAGIDPDITDKDENSILTRAIWKSDLELVRCLLYHGANVNGVSGGIPPLCTACRYGELDIAKLLIDFGADIEKADILGHTPLYNATIYGYKAVGQYLLRHGANWKKTGLSKLAFSTMYGGKIRFRWTLMRTTDKEEMNQALHFTVLNNDLKRTRILLDRGADPNKEMYEETPLRTAVNSKNTEIMDLLLKRDADPNLPNCIGSTPLHWAAYTTPEVISLLLQYGADPEMQDNKGETPYDWAQYDDIKTLLGESLGNRLRRLFDESEITRQNSTIQRKKGFWGWMLRCFRFQDEQ